MVGEEIYFIKGFFEKTKLKDVMTTKFHTIAEDENVSVVGEIFVNNNIYYLFVVNKDDKLIGLVSQKYLYKTQSPRKLVNKDVQYNPDVLIDGESFYNKESLNSYILKSLMLKDPFTLGPEDSVAEAIRQMEKKNLGCIPIIEAGGKICGVFTHFEMVQFVSEILKV